MTARRLSALSVPSAIGAILVLLGLLATLQYRWVGELGTAESARLRTEARNHADALTREFDLEVTRVFIGLQLNRGEAVARRDFSGYAERYETWRRSTAYPSLVRDLFLVEVEGERLALARYEAARGTFEATEWPPALDPVRRRTEELVGGLFRADKEGRWRPPRPPGPIVEEIPALILFGFSFVVRGDGPGPEGAARGTFRFEGPRAGLFEFGFGGGRDGRRPEGAVRGLSRSEGPRAGVFPIPPPDGQRPEPLWPRPMVIVVLDAEAIRQRILPALAERHFSGTEGQEYDLTVVRQEDRRHVVWRSRRDAPRTGAPDAEAGLLDLRFEDSDTAAARRFPGGRAHTADTGFWRLLVSHRAGPLDQVVAAARRRNLAVGFGILLLLGASVALVVVSSQRARRLGERQMEFVAAVSHELRTPVAAICSTSENLADGIVAEPAQVRTYGAAIHAEGRRLADMVERVLEFAGTTRVRPGAPPEAVEVSALVDESLRPFESELRERDFTLVRQVAPDLPPIRGDAFALRRALQNLFENALKYDKGGRWLAVRAEPGEGGRGVRISVEDHGDGIAPGELDQVFEPFFRGREARAAQAPGFGLGLALARRVAETHGGRLRVDSAAGRGATFTLDLPGTRRAATSAHPATSDVVTEPDR